MRGALTSHHFLLTQYRIKRRLVATFCFCVICLGKLYPFLGRNSDYSTPTSVHREYVDDTMVKSTTTSPVHPSDPIALKKHVAVSAVLVRDTSDVGKLTGRKISIVPEGADRTVASHHRAFPRLVYIDDDAAHLNNSALGRPNKTLDIHVDSQSLKAMERIADDDNYWEISEYAGRDRIEGISKKAYPSSKADKCVPMAKWQTMSHPACNVLHEIDNTRIGEFLHLGTGYSNDVFRVTDHNGKYLALKLLSPKDVAKDYATIVSVAAVILHMILVRVLQ